MKNIKVLCILVVFVMTLLCACGESNEICTVTQVEPTTAIMAPENTSEATMSAEETPTTTQTTYSNILSDEVFVKETIYNSAGKEFVIKYNPDCDFDEDEAILLAKFAEHEGGTEEEKELIMKAIASRVLNNEFPDDVKSVLCQQNLLYINTELWNQIEPSVEMVEKARIILDTNEEYQYKWYYIKIFGEEYKDMMIDPEAAMETENYIFF